MLWHSQSIPSEANGRRRAKQTSEAGFSSNEFSDKPVTASVTGLFCVIVVMGVALIPIRGRALLYSDVVQFLKAC